MNRNSTPLSNIEFAVLIRKAVRQEREVKPKDSTLQFLKKLARNYRTMESMPEGLQGYMLS